MNISYKNIGARIRYIRTQKGISQEKLAELADVSAVYISNVERGEKSASLKVIISVANALKVTSDSLLADCLNSFDLDNVNNEFCVLHDCSREENDIIIESMKSLKNILRGYSISE